MYHWILQVHVKKSVLSTAAYDIYLAQCCLAAGAGKEAGRQMGKGLTGHYTLPSQQLMQCGAEQMPYIYHTDSS